MARGKPKPWMLCVLGVAVAAFITDQFLASADADQTPSALDGAAQAESKTTTTEQPIATDPSPTLSDHFDSFASDHRANEDEFAGAFSPLKSDRETGDSRAEIERDTPDAHGLKLSAVLRRDDGDLAVINGRPLRVGQSLGSVKVLSIDAREVRVQTDIGPITLSLYRPSLQTK